MGRRESPLDPGAGPAQEFAHALRRLRAGAGGPTYRAMAAAGAFSSTTLSDAAAGRRLPSLEVVLAYVQACGGDREEWTERWRAARDEVAGRPPDDDGAAPPYRGLARYEPEDRDLFFGREESVAQALTLVGTRRFAALVGASGSGKSSLLRAAVLPALRERQAPAPRLAAVRIVAPGARPARTHASRLVPHPGEDDTLVVVDQFEEVFTLCTDPRERAGFVDALLAARDDGSRLRVLLAVRADFFDRCAEHPGLAEALGDATLLLGPMRAGGLRQAVVRPAAAAGLIVERSLTARIVAETAREPGGLPLMSHALLETWRRRRGRVLTEEMYEAAGGIHGAVAATAEDFHHRLTASQAAAARRILLRLVTPGRGTRDTRRPAPRAELETGSEDTRVVLEKLVRARLLTTDGDTVDLAHEALLSAWPRLRRWIEEDRERLVLHRQLTEAARLWADHGRDPGFLYRGSRLAAASAAFDGRDRDALTGVESAFLDAGAAVRDREIHLAARTTRRLRGLAATLVVLLVLALTAALLAWNQTVASNRARNDALSLQRAAQSAVALTADPDRGLLLALQAYRTSATPEAVAALYRAAATPLRRSLAAVTRSAVTALAFSGDGRSVAWGSRDGTVAVAEVAGGRTRTLRTGSSARVDGLAFTDDDRTLVISDAASRLTACDLAGGPDVTARPGSWLTGEWDTGSALSPDGRTVAAVADPRPGHVAFALIDTATGRPVRVLHTRDADEARDGRLGLPGPSRTMLAVSPDGHTVATATAHGPALWDTATGGSRGTFTASGDVDATTVAFSSDSRVVAAADGSGRVQVRDPSTGGRSRTFAASGSLDNAVGALAFLPGRPVLAVGSADGSLSLWDARTDRVAALRQGDSRGSDATAAEEDGAQDTSPSIRNGTHAITALRSGPDGTLLASGSADGTVRLWDSATELPYATLPSARASRRSDSSGNVSAFASQGRTLAAVQQDGTVRSSGLGAAAPSAGAVVDLHTDQAPRDLVSSPDGRLLAALGDSGGVWLWSAGQGPGRVRRLTRGAASGAAFGPDGKTLATADDDFTIRLWNTSTGRVTRTIPVHPPDQAVQLAFSPDGRLLAVGGTDGSVRLADVATGRLRPMRRGWTVPQAGDAAFLPRLTLLAFSPDGRTLAAGGRTGAVSRWDVDSGRPRAALAATTSPVTALAYSPDGGTLAVAAEDGATRMWDLPTGSVRLTLDSDGSPVNTVRFAPDGSTLAVSTDGGATGLWRLSLPTPTRSVDRLCAALPASPARDGVCGTR